MMAAAGWVADDPGRRGGQGMTPAAAEFGGRLGTRSREYSRTLPCPVIARFPGGNQYNSVFLLPGPGPETALAAQVAMRGTLALRARPSAQCRSRLICSSMVLASGTVSASVARTDSVVISRRS